MSKYIIEIEDEPLWRQSALHGENVLFKAKEFNALVFDKNGLDKLIPLDKALNSELGEAYHKGFEEGQNKKEDGCVGCRYDDGMTEHSPCIYCCNAYSNQWSAKQKNDNKIKIGDEVINTSEFLNGDIGFIASTLLNGYYNVLRFADGRIVDRMWKKENCKKTGKHNDAVAELLKAMNGKQRNCSACEHDGDPRFCDPCRHNDM